MTEIDGLDIHFIHVRSAHADALPLIVTHGWPGSIVEQLKVIEPLTDPAAHGGSGADAFDVVIPSLPGHGFSAKPATTGWDRISRSAPGSISISAAAIVLERVKLRESVMRSTTACSLSGLLCVHVPRGGISSLIG